MPASVPEVLAGWMQPFSVCFTTAVWRHVLVLVAGALLAPGRRTVTATLRIMGLDQAPGFAVYHRVLSLGRWSSRALAHRLLLLLVAAFVPTGPVVVGIDDTIERRWGAKIKARGIYRDPVRSSHGHFVKASGLRSAQNPPVCTTSSARGHGTRNLKNNPLKVGLLIWQTWFSRRHLLRSIFHNQPYATEVKAGTLRDTPGSSFQSILKSTPRLLLPPLVNLHKILRFNRLSHRYPQTR